MDQGRLAHRSKKHDSAALIIRRVADGNLFGRSLEDTALSRLKRFAAVLAFLLIFIQLITSSAFAQDSVSLEHPATIRGTVISRVSRSVALWLASPASWIIPTSNREL
jgi:hypothetical protein